jgi:hypothetical protein
MISELEARALHDTFWRRMTTRLPPHVQSRYESAFQAMERYTTVFEAVTAAGAATRRGLGMGCRAAARMLDYAAQRLLLPR